MNRFERFLKRSRPYVVITWLTILFLVLLLWPRIFVSIKPGQAGVLWLRFGGGTIIDRVYPEGFHFIFPWDQMWIYDVRIQSISEEVKVLTQNGLRVGVRLTIRYHPQYDMLGVLHQQVGPDYVRRIVIPEVESSLRAMIASYNTEQVYTLQNEIVSKIINQAGSGAAHRYVRIDDVLIREIVLPELIQEAIEQKIEQMELAMAYEYRLQREEAEKERRRIEAEGWKAANIILASSITDDLLTWRGIEATRALAESDNSKIVVIGAGQGGLPLILNTETR